MTPERIALPKETEVAEQIERACNDIINIRHRPLLLLYYPDPYGQMEESDVADTYQAFQAANVSVEERLPECDVLIHTYGGNPLAGYRLAQVVRDFASNIAFLVPEHAYSAGTLTCFAGNEIMLGHYAGLSPIDITREEVELTSIDYFVNFAKDCEIKVQQVLKENDKASSGITVASELLCELVQQVGALKVGEYYRARALTGYYAQELLDRYMLADAPNKKGRRNKIIRELLFKAPAHQFHLDFHMCADIGLIVKEMDTRESVLTKKLITLLDGLVQTEIICPNITDEVKMPFIAFYPWRDGGDTDEPK